MGKFKAGDRVRYVGGSREYVSKELPRKSGSVVTVSSDRDILVHWDDGSTPAEMFPENLELLPPLPSPHVADPIPAAIAEYHDACAAFESAQLAVEKAKARIEDARLALKEAL